MSKDMTYEELLKRFGLSPKPEDLPAIREIFREATGLERGRQGAGDTAVMTLCCAQLFCAGQVTDSLEIWRAKNASMDADAAVDIRLLCGAWLVPTKQYLADLKTEEAAAAFSSLTASEEAGDFDEFSVDEYKAALKEYYA